MARLVSPQSSPVRPVFCGPRPVRPVPHRVGSTRPAPPELPPLTARDVVAIAIVKLGLAASAVLAVVLVLLVIAGAYSWAVAA